MADPISAFGLACEIGSLVKGLYDYGASVRSAQRHIIAISGELTALKSALELFSTTNEGDTTVSQDFRNMLQSTQALISDLAQALTPKSTVSGRTLQSLKWPFSSAAVNEKLTRLERLKTWFIMAFAMDTKANSQKLVDTMRELADLVQRQHLTSEQSRQEREGDRQLLASIAPEKPYFAHENACRPWQGTLTGSWFVQGEFRAWLEHAAPQERFMLLIGRSGSGKTTLMSRAIEDARQFAGTKTDVYLAYFYCAYNNVESRHTRNILGSWIAQIAQRNSDVLDDFRSSKRLVDDITVRQLENCIIKVSESRKLLLVLDAINESTDADELVSCFEHMIASSINVQILVSTTPHCKAIHELPKRTAHIVSMLPQCVKQDITIYINHQISKHRVLSKIPADEIVQTLLPRSEGMFRWVDCQMSFLTSQLTPNAVRKAMRSLPGTLDSTYELMLDRVPPSSCSLVKQVLMWLSFCQRPLALDEVCEAAVLEEDQTTMGDDDRIDDAEGLLAMCQGLAELDPATGAVTLAHSSVKAFLTGTYIRTSKAAHFALDPEICLLELLRKCVIYLSMQPFKGGRPSEGREAERRTIIENTLLAYPLLDYSSRFWAIHARSCTLTGVEVDLIKQFFETQREPEGGNFAFWICCFLPKYAIGSLHDTQPLYYAASYGLTSIVKVLLESGLISKDCQTSGWYIDYKGGRYFSTALQVASWRGHLEVVELLLDAGANPNVTDKNGMACITGARVHGHTKIVERLKMAGGAQKVQKRKSHKAQAGDANSMSRAATGDQRSVVEHVSTDTG